MDLMKTVAIYGGSFNPITNAHLTIAAAVLHSGEADKVWFVPCGDRDDKSASFANISAINRYEMTVLGVQNFFTQSFHDEVVDVLSTEIGGPAKGTLSLMRLFKQLYPCYQFAFIIGSDLLTGLRDWGDSEVSPSVEEANECLMAECMFLVYERSGYPIREEYLPTNFRIVCPPFDGCTLPQSNLSSSDVRSRLAKSFQKHHLLPSSSTRNREFFIDGLVPPSVVEYIRENKLYK